jgi:phosphatidylserine decarboxylase
MATTKKLVCNTRNYSGLRFGVDYAQNETGRFVKNSRNMVTATETGNLVGIKVAGTPVRYYKLSNFITQ